MKIVVAGGGAAGFFAAIRCREHASEASLTLIEKSRRPLAKVEASGGGRCNLTHASPDPRRLAEHYPRGGPELIGAFHRWGVEETTRWFESHGVPLRTETDGRVFPASNSSRSVGDGLVREARRAGITVRMSAGLVSARAEGTHFALTLTDGSALNCDKLLIATGGSSRPAGYAVPASLGHTIVPPVPSLFSLVSRDARLHGLAGVSFPAIRLRVPGTPLTQDGALLITHDGISGPAVLDLSAWGARAFHAAGYRFELAVSWCPGHSGAEVHAQMAAARKSRPRRKVVKDPLASLPQRLWESLAAASGCPDGLTWTHVSDAQAESLLDQLLDTRLAVTGKQPNKEEFVTSGGVSLKEVDFKTMQSRICPGLYFAGEVLDIDGLTGGYNLQAAWTTGAIAGQSIGRA